MILTTRDQIILEQFTQGLDNRFTQGLING